jgi:hypothetical protein
MGAKLPMANKSKTRLKLKNRSISKGMGKEA